MFDIGFWELTVIAIVGIVVVGPDRLPEVVKTLAITLRKIRRMFSDVKADISRELDLDDMRKIIKETEIDEHIKQLNQSVMDMKYGFDHMGDDENDINAPIKNIEETIDNTRQAVKDIFQDPDEQQKATEQADTGIEQDPSASAKSFAQKSHITEIATTNLDSSNHNDQSPPPTNDTSS